MKCFSKSLSLIAIFSALTLGGSHTANACIKNNHVRPVDLAADTVSKLFKDKNYKELDKLYATYLTEKTATPDGISALSAYYKGISQSFNVCASPAKSDAEWKAHVASLLAWRQASPGSDAAKFASTLFMIDYAWYGRGYGYSSTVSAASRDVHASRMASAEHQLDQLAKSGINNPAWYSGMISVGLAQGWPSEKIDALYQTAIKLDPYYIEIHYNRAAYYSAKWYGSEAQMAGAIDQATESTRPRLGQTMYARLHWTESQAQDMFEPGKVKWERMKSGFDDYLAIYSDTSTRSNYADFACMANDAKSVKRQLELLDGKVDLKAWGNENHYKFCVALAKNSENGIKPQCFKVKDTGEIFCE